MTKETKLPSSLLREYEKVAKEKVEGDLRRRRKPIPQVKIEALSELTDHGLAANPRDVQRAKTLTLVRRVIDPETLAKAGPTLVKGRKL